jgi:hypothetical protein
MKHTLSSLDPVVLLLFRLVLHLFLSPARHLALLVHIVFQGDHLPDLFGSQRLGDLVLSRAINSSLGVYLKFPDFYLWQFTVIVFNKLTESLKRRRKRVNKMKQQLITVQ